MPQNLCTPCKFRCVCTMKGLLPIAGGLKKTPSRFGTKSRGSSFTAFIDEFDPDAGDIGHLTLDSATEIAKDTRGMAACNDPLKESHTEGGKHRRTTR